MGKGGAIGIESYAHASAATWEAQQQQPKVMDQSDSSTKNTYYNPVRVSGNLQEKPRYVPMNPPMPVQATQSANTNATLQPDSSAMMADDFDIPTMDMEQVQSRLLTSLESMLQWSHMELVAMPAPHKLESMFYSVSKQSFSLEFYLRRLITYMSDCSPAVFVVAMIYLKRIQTAYVSLEPNEMNVHRLVLTALLVASKYVDDIGYSNAYVAKVGGIQSVQEMNRMESTFLNLLQFKCHVNVELYTKYEQIILGQLGGLSSSYEKVFGTPSLFLETESI